MKASLNELRSLLKQVFEGCGLDHGAYESAADLVLWSQANGLPGFELLEGAIQQCLQSPKVHMTMEEDVTHSYRMDAAGNSILMCGALLSDVVSASALESDFSMCKLSNARNAIFLAKPLVDARRQGLFGMVYWVAGKQIHVIKSAEQECIDYLLYPAGHGVEGALDNVTLIYARDQHRIDQYQSDLWQSSDEANVCLSASQVKNHRQSAINEGLAISDSLWNTLNRVAGNVLVESTEQSRLGAGA